MTNDISDSDTIRNNERLHVNDNVDALRFTEIKKLCFQAVKTNFRK